MVNCPFNRNNNKLIISLILLILIFASVSYIIYHSFACDSNNTITNNYKANNQNKCDSGRQVKSGLTKLVIDTDAGGDDAIAILLALSAIIKGHSVFQVAAITCVFGNTEEKNVEQNVLKILTIANRTDIPVYGGTQKPLIDSFNNENWFGQDGFGDFDFGQDIKGQIDNSTHAALALVNLAKLYSGDLYILALGPLTNIATAITLDPNFIHNVKQIYIMGGSVSGIGNKSPGVEYNFGNDPDASAIVFQAMVGHPGVLFSWETTSSVSISKDWRINELGSINSTLINLINNAERISLNKTENWQPADAMTAAYMIWPELSNKTLITNVTPVNDGAARGGLLVDYTRITSKKANAEIIQDFNVEKFKLLLISFLS